MPNIIRLSDEIAAYTSTSIGNNVVFGSYGLGETYIEPPVEINAGLFDVDFIGAFSYLGGGRSSIRHVSMIGRFCAIAANVVMGEVEHPTDILSAHPLFEGASRFAWHQARQFKQENAALIRGTQKHCAEMRRTRFGKIEIGNDVWIGEGAFIRQGVKIGDGAIIGARSIILSDVPPYAIVAGMPARVLRYRFPPDVIAELLRLNWWSYGLSALHGVDLTDMESAIGLIEKNIGSGQAVLYSSPLLHLDRTGSSSLLDYDGDTGELRPHSIVAS